MVLEGMVRKGIDIEAQSITVEVNLDLADDEVCIGGETALGTRLLSRIFDDGSGLRGYLGVITAAGSTTSLTLTETDDDIIAVGQDADVVLPLNYAYNVTRDQWERMEQIFEAGSVAVNRDPLLTLPLNYFYEELDGEWHRINGGTDNAVLSAPIRGLSVGGLVTDPLQTFANGDFSLFHFDTNGRLLTNMEGLVEDDDDAIAAGQTTGLGLTLPYYYNRDTSQWERQAGRNDDDSVPTASGTPSVLNIPYFSNLDNTGIWERWTGRTDDDTLPAGDASPTILNLLHGFDTVNNNWRRVTAIEDNDSIGGPPLPAGVMTEGMTMSGFPSFAASDACVDRFTIEGAKIATLREQEPYEIAAVSDASGIASGTTLVIASAIQQNDFFLGSHGRTVLNGMFNYAGAASSVTLQVQISTNGGGTFFTVDSFTVNSGTPSVIRDLSVAMGNRVRLRAINNDAGNTTGQTDYGFYLTSN
jgi:hypothetical protein